MICFFHSSDLDGHCSGAIVKHFRPECRLCGINYGKEFPWDKIEKGERVYVVDFTLQPFDQMEKLNQLSNLVWIDHHKTEVEESQKRGFKASGFKSIKVGIGACELVWKVFSERPVPIAVHLLALYDVWDHSDPRVLPFQYGFRFNKDTYPENQDLWSPFFDRDCDKVIKTTIQTGSLLLEYEKRQNEKMCKTLVYETVLRRPLALSERLEDETFKPYSAVCINRGFINSMLFESIFDPNKHDLMIAFSRLKPPAGVWTVSLYSTKEDIDCGEIARVFGGGGHKGAAGFQCRELPFDY